MQKTWGLDVTSTSDREWLDEKWKKVFKNKAEVIIGVKYDFQKIKHNKALVQVWENEVNLELTKALVHITGRFCPEDNQRQRKHVDGIELHTSYVHPTSDTGTGSTVPLVEMRTRMGSGVTGKKREQSLPSTDFDGRVARGQVAESEQERYRPEGVEVESIMALKAELAARQEEQDKHPLPNSTGGVRLLRVGEQPVGGRHAPQRLAAEHQDLI